MDINLFLLEPEKIYGLKANEDFKEQKINRCIESDNYVASLKKDGQYHRYVNFNGEIKMQTRGKSVKTKTFGEIQEKVPHLMEYLNKVVPKNSLLVGEVYRPGWTTNEVGSILRCLPPKAIFRQKETPLMFFIHDVWYWNGENCMIKTKTERNQKLLEIKDYFLRAGGESDYIRFAKYVDNPEDIKRMMQFAFDNDEEGLVLTLKNAIVNPGTRTAWKTLKIKKELQNDADVFLTGRYKLPEKYYTGKEIETWNYWMNEKTTEMVEGKLYKDYLGGATIIPVTKPFFMKWPGSVEMAVINKDNERVPIGWLSGLTDEIRQDFITNHNEYIDRVCKVQAMETTEDHKLRHAKFMDFRDDIDITDCTFEKVFGEE